MASLAFTAPALLVAFAGALASAQVSSPGGPDAGAERAHLRTAQQAVFRQALAAVTPGIVRIDTIGGAQPIDRDEEGSPIPAASGFRQADGPTTGVIWSADGYIITSSFNFVRDPSIITVALHDGRQAVARLVARDHANRLALLKIDAADLPVPDWIPPDLLRPGQWALAAGLGFGSEQPALTVGTLSAVGRLGGIAVQTDAKISPSNYGGPLFDLAGRVMGICVPTAGGDDSQLAGVEWYDSGIGFAIDASVLADRVARLQDGRDLHRGVMGVAVDSQHPVVGPADGAGAEPSEAASAAGLTIIGEPRGPAAGAGLEAGDVLLEVDGTPIGSARDLRRCLARKAAGDTVSVRFRRADQTRTADLTLVSTAELSRVPTSAPVTTGESPATAPATLPGE